MADSVMERLLSPWVASGFVFVVVLVASLSYQNSRRNNYPPCLSGLIPWLGCAIEFGKSPLYFIDEAMKKMGPVFTLKMTGKRLTFIMDPEDFHYFFQSANVDFQRAVQPSVQKAANITAGSFLAYHTKMHDNLKGRLAPAQLTPFCESLSTKFAAELDKRWGDRGEGDLNELTRSTMYVVILDNLFGKNVLPTESEETFKLFEQHFIKFDEDFEYGSQLPEMFLKEWKTSKWWLLDIFNNVVNKLSEQRTPVDDETVFQTLMRIIGTDGCAPKFGLLMMWAALANAIPITFWTIGMILDHPNIAKQLKREIAHVMNENGKEVGQLTQDDLQQMPGVKRCVLEAIRLRSPGVITRGVAKPFKLRGYTIPKGDFLMLSPYWAHRNEKYFPNPDQFKPERWSEINLDKSGFLEGFIGFGGGRYQCPGRWFGLLEIQLMVTMLMYKYDITLLDKVPELSPLHLVGTQQPVGTLKVSYRPSS